jgi:hypothetical protein
MNYGIANNTESAFIMQNKAICQYLIIKM